MARLVASLLLLVVTTWLDSACALTASGRRPNIVLIVADDLGFNDVSYHESEIKTPTLDKLSKHGVRLENYYVQPICSPTRCQLMTGRYQIRYGRQHGVFGDQAVGLPLDETTMAEKLREVGYATHLVGKWHLGLHKIDYLPTRRGFDSFFGFLGGHEDHYTHMRTYRLTRKAYLDLRENEDVAQIGHIHSTYMYTQKAVDVIEKHDKNKPLFLYAAYQAVHNPLQAPESYKNRYRHIKNEDRKKYAAMVTMLDEGIANLTQSLKDNGLWNDTILVFTTDNGGTLKYGGSNYPLKGGKFSLWEGGIRGIGFVTGGKNIALRRDAVSKELTHASDWFPTLLGVAGANFNGTKPLDGLDQWDSISTGAKSPRQWLLHNIDSKHKKRGIRAYNDTFDTRIRAAIRVDDYKLVTGDAGPIYRSPHPKRNDLKGNTAKVLSNKCKAKEHERNLWLFNIAEDPQEQHDLSSEDEHQGRIKKMLDQLQKLNKEALPPYYPEHTEAEDPARHGDVFGPWL